MKKKKEKQEKETKLRPEGHTSPKQLYKHTFH